MVNGRLHRYFLNNAEARLHKWIHYFDVYEHHFHRFIGQKPTILEIGIFGGGSLKMWKDYFGDGAKVVGIDINPECKKHEGEGVEIFIGDQSDSALLNRVIEAYPQIDIVLDDGSHQQGDMIASFDHLYHKISPNGLYMVEDTHTSYWEEYGGGHLTAGSFIEFAKRKIDDLNAVHSREKVKVNSFTRTTHSISFYDSIVVFEKRPQGARQAPKTGPMSD